MGWPFKGGSTVSLYGTTVVITVFQRLLHIPTELLLFVDCEPLPLGGRSVPCKIATAYGGGGPAEPDDWLLLPDDEALLTDIRECGRLLPFLRWSMEDTAIDWRILGAGIL